MSGSSGHGSARPPAAPGQRQAGGRAQGAAGRGGAGGRAGAGRPAGGRTAGERRGDGQRPASGQRSASERAAAVAVDAERLADLLEPVISAAGLDLEGVRVTSAGRRRLLRIVVDGDGGVGLDDIAVISRDVSAALDDNAAMGEQPYTLEVSSPGVDRPLTERRHWRRAIGRLVTAPLLTAPEGDDQARPVIEGRITGASADGITLEADGTSRTFGYADLGPGKIKIEFAPIDAGDTDDEGADEEGSDGY